VTAFANTPAGDDAGANDENSAINSEIEDETTQEETPHATGQQQGEVAPSVPGTRREPEGGSSDASPSAEDPSAVSDVDGAPRPDEVPSGESVSNVVSLDHFGFTLLRYRLVQVGEVVKIISATLLEVRGPADGPDGEGGSGGGGVGPLDPAPTGGLDCEADDPAPAGGLLSIFEVFNLP
jgi:hypothetical protein